MRKFGLKRMLARNVLNVVLSHCVVSYVIHMCKERFLTIVLRSGMDCISQEILGLCPSNAQVEILEDY